MIDTDFINEVIERASEEGVPYNHKFECVYKLIQNFILVHDMESNEGQALLYAVEKTAERTKRETLLEVLNWIEGMYDTDYVAGDIVRMLKNKLNKLNNDQSKS